VHSNRHLFAVRALCAGANRVCFSRPIFARASYDLGQSLMCLKVCVYRTGCAHHTPKRMSTFYIVSAAIFHFRSKANFPPGVQYSETHALASPIPQSVPILCYTLQRTCNHANRSRYSSIYTYACFILTIHIYIYIYICIIIRTYSISCVQYVCPLQRHPYSSWYGIGTGTVRYTYSTVVARRGVPVL
jgi:hypothetical protein